jgi:hypothetical protein
MRINVHVHHSRGEFPPERHGQDVERLENILADLVRSEQEARSEALRAYAWAVLALGASIAIAAIGMMPDDVGLERYLAFVLGVLGLLLMIRGIVWFGARREPPRSR